MSDGLVGHIDGEAVTVGLGIDHHRLDAHAPGGANDADRHLAAVGDQDFLEHCGVLRAGIGDWGIGIGSERDPSIPQSPNS